jgi:ATP-dependent DNA helicase RecG
VLKKTTQKTTQKRILDLLRKSPSLSRRELAEILEDITEDGVKYHIDKLKKEGKIERIGGDRGGYWKINFGERSAK